jgi:SAM-dependent methyltransferase
VVLAGLKARIAKEEFSPRILSFFSNPYYITRRSLADKIESVAPTFTGEVLDFGCGSKPYRAHFSNVSSYVGVDVEVSGHDHANSSVDYFYDGHTLPFPDRSFDGLVSFEVFEHVVNISEMMPEISRVVRPGGLIVVTTPFAFPEHEVPYDFRRYTAFGLESLLTRNDFDVLSTYRYPSAPLTIAQFIVHYVFAHLSPRNTIIKTGLHLLISVPVQLFAFALAKISAAESDLYIGSMIIARKR